MKVKELIKALKRANRNDNVLLTIMRPDQRGIRHGYFANVNDVLSLEGDTIIKGELDIIDPIESTESVVKRIAGLELTDAMKEEMERIDKEVKK